MRAFRSCSDLSPHKVQKTLAVSGLSAKEGVIEKVQSVIIW